MQLLCKGVGASPGMARGKLAFSAQDAVARAKSETIVFVCDESGAEDRPGIEAAVAVVSVRGGLTGDAAIMARALGKPCVIGVPGARVVYKEKKFVVLGHGGSPDLELTERDELEVNGGNGELKKV